MVECSDGEEDSGLVAHKNKVMMFNKGESEEWFY